MLEKTIQAIAFALQEAFGEAYKVNTDGSGQPDGPCFQVLPIRVERVKGTCGRCTQMENFEIRYTPGGGGVGNCAAVLERMYDALECIMTDGNAVWSHASWGGIREGRAYFFARYDVLLEKEPDVAMEHAEIRITDKTQERKGE